MADQVLLPLSPMDALANGFDITIVYIFPPSSSPYSLDKLQSSFLALVEQDYPILLGELDTDPKTGMVRVKQSLEHRRPGAAAGIRFETMPSNSMTTEQTMQEESRDLMPRSPRGKTELICVKGTLLADGGLAVGVNASHTLLDGEAMSTFMTLWGQHYSGVEKEHRLVVNHDRHLLNGTRTSSNMPHPEFRVVDTGAEAPENDFFCPTNGQVPPPIAHHAFHFTPDMMKKIKEVATFSGLAKDQAASTEVSYVSTLDAITALFTVLVARARGHGQDVLTVTGVNARRRLNPPLPANYAGNVIFNALSTYSADELQSDDDKLAVVTPAKLGEFARRVRESILRFDDTCLRDTINFLTEHNMGAVRLATNFMFGPDLVFTSWLRMGLYDPKFDGVRPWSACAPRVPSLGGVVIFNEAQKGGEGIDVGVCLECDAMEKLKTMFEEVSYLYQ